MEHEINKVKDKIMSTVFEQSMWADSLTALSSITRSAGVVLLPVSNRRPGVIKTQSVSELVEAYFRDGWDTRDARSAGLSTLRARGIFTEADFISPEDINKNAYYQELLEPHGFRLFAGLRFYVGNEPWCAAIQRTRNQEAFDERDLKLISLFEEPLTNATTLASRLDLHRLNGICDAFDLLRGGCALLDAEGRVIRVNTSAERLLSGDVTLSNGRIRSSHKSDQINLDTAIYLATQSSYLTNCSRHSKSMTLRSKNSSIFISIMPVTESLNDQFSPGRVLIFLDALTSKQQTPANWLLSLFGLTTAEALVASALCDGESLESIAERRSLSKETLRSQLKAVYSKTSTHRQAELVALLGRLGSRHPMPTTE